MRLLLTIAFAGSLGFSLSAQTTTSITSFNAVPREQQVLLTWHPDKAEVKSYNLEKSKNGADFIAFGSVQGVENDIEFLETDFTPFDGLSYYRLVLVANDGTVSYSNVVPVKYENGIPVSPVASTDNTPLNKQKDKSVLVIVRSSGGDEYYSKVDVQSIGDPVMCKDPDPVIAVGTYTIVGCSEQELYSKQIIVN